jgi:hypothetical protein
MIKVSDKVIVEYNTNSGQNTTRESKKGEVICITAPTLSRPVYCVRCDNNLFINCDQEHIKQVEQEGGQQLLFW